MCRELKSEAVIDEELYEKPKPLLITIASDLRDDPFDLRDGVISIDEGRVKQTTPEDSQVKQFTLEGSQMRIEQRIVAAWVARLGSQVVSDVINGLEGMEAALSGDSGLRLLLRPERLHSTSWFF